MSLSHSELKRLLHYDPETGTWTRLTGPRKGRTTGFVDKTKGNYLFVVVKTKRYRAHRLAWFYVHEKWPAHLVDHGDRDKSHAAFNNLRRATKSQNGANSKTWSNNTSGFKGVWRDKRLKKWRVGIQHLGKKLDFGLYDCRCAAHFMHIVEYHKLFGEFAHVE